MCVDDLYPQVLKLVSSLLQNPPEFHHQTLIDWSAPQMYDPGMKTPNLSSPFLKPSMQKNSDSVPSPLQQSVMYICHSFSGV
jgi:hypothetical protein